MSIKDPQTCQDQGYLPKAKSPDWGAGDAFSKGLSDSGFPMSHKKAGKSASSTGKVAPYKDTLKPGSGGK